MVSQEPENLQKLRQEVRSWLQANLPKGWGTPEYVPPAPGREAHEFGKAWTKKVYDAGYTGFGYPKEYGGIERPRAEIAIIREEFARTGQPPGAGGLAMLVAGPTILREGQEWQKKRFLPKMLNGEECWAEGFSEPNAGSDLANMETTAVRDGDEWVVNGQKVWSSSFEFADWGVLVVKTDPDAPRHRNLSYFIYSTSYPGYSRRPIKQMTGDAQFGEQFFDNVRIPHENMLGQIGRGWYVAMATLETERGGGAVAGAEIGGSAGGAAAGRGRAAGYGTAAIVELARETKRYGKSVWEDPAFRQKIVQIAIESQAGTTSGQRSIARRRKGQLPQEMVSMSKNWRSELGQRRGDLVMEIIGAYSQLVRGSKYTIDNGTWVYTMLRSRGSTIEEGTSEINRNIIAERILGLPR